MLSNVKAKKTKREGKVMSQNMKTQVTLEQLKEVVPTTEVDGKAIAVASVDVIEQLEKSAQAAQANASLSRQNAGNQPTTVIYGGPDIGEIAVRNSLLEKSMVELSTMLEAVVKGGMTAEESSAVAEMAKALVQKENLLAQVELLREKINRLELVAKGPLAIRNELMVAYQFVMATTFSVKVLPTKRGKKK